jgi:CoA:oxalate CoA-transferase
MTASPDHNGPLALSGCKVVDFSRLLPGPWCAQLLGDLGADVIKVEQPGIGDHSRHNPPNFAASGVYFNAVNTNKRGLCVDLSTPDGQEVGQRLLRWADVVIESYRPGVAVRLGVDYDTAKRLNPCVVYASFSGYGQTGPLAGIPGHDLVVQAITGLMGTRLDAEPLPPVPGLQAADYAGAAMGAIGLLAALMRKQANGVGTHLDISLFDSLFSMCQIVHTASLAKLAGYMGAPKMAVWGSNPRYSTYLARDGKPVAVSLLETRIWAHFCRHIGRPDLLSEDEGPEHRHTAHGEYAIAYRQAIAQFCASKPRDALCAEMEQYNIPICPVYTPEEALTQPHVTARGLVRQVEHPNEGPMALLANPLSLSGLTLEGRRPAPTLGGDNHDILTELGYSDVEQQNLRMQAVITPAEGGNGYATRE